MATTILRHDALILTSSFRSRDSRPNCRSEAIANANPNAKPNGSFSRRRKRSPVGSQSAGRDVPRQTRYGVKSNSNSRSKSLVAKFPGKKNLVMEQVKILKRGKSLCQENRNSRVCVDEVGNQKAGMKKGVDMDLDLVLGSTDRLGPEPEMVQKQINVSDFKVVDGVYAGSGVFSASPPPSSVPLPAFLDRKGIATNDLQRWLRLDSV